MAYRKSLDFLPQVFQTDTNQKLLNSTLDQLISEPELKRISGYIGRRFNPALTPEDSYIQETYADRQKYQLEPSSIVNDENDNLIFANTYLDLLNRIQSLGGIVDNPDRLFSAEEYTYSGLFDFDKLINYSSYYWLPTGPDSVDVFATDIPLDLDISVSSPESFTVTNGQFAFEKFDSVGFDVSENSISSLRNVGYQFDLVPGEFNPLLRLARGGTYRFNVNQKGHGFFIQSQPGSNDSFNWQQNLSIREVLGVENNGADQGTITFNVPTKEAQDFFLNLETQDTVNLVGYSYLKKRHLRYNEVQNANYNLFVSQNFGIDAQRFLDGKTVVFVKDISSNRVPQPWQAGTFYNEGDLIVYANTIYRVLSAYTSGRIFSFNNNLEIYDLGDHWYDPALFDDDFGFDSTNFDRGDTVPLENRLGWFRIAIDEQGIIRLTPEDVVEINNKINIGEGSEYGNRSFYRNSNNELVLVPPITANSEFLFYQDALDPTLSGIIQIVDQDNELSIDIDNILGSENYISPNGIKFENGLKIRFFEDVKQTEYHNREYYVEGVGESITLTSVDDLQTPEDWLETVDVAYDSTLYDAEGFDQSQPAPKQKQYITIKRNSQECSAWTRQNRWFHENVIINTSAYNNYTPVIDQNSRAKRPIIEFDPNLQLFNFGKTFVDNVTVVDSVQLDALSNVEGLATENYSDGSIASYYADGVALVPGNKIIFANDLDANVKNKIWLVDWITPESNQNNKTADFTGDGVTTSFDLNFDVSTPIRLSVRINGLQADNAGYLWIVNDQILTFNSAPPDGSDISVSYNFGSQIHLEPVHEATDGDVVTVILGVKNQGTNYYFNGTDWIKGQSKTLSNQAPYFDLYDDEQISLSNTDKYPSNNFVGNKIFSYKLGSGKTDPELNLKLSYQNIGNIGDIVFVDHINNDQFNYEDQESIKFKTTVGNEVRKNLQGGTSLYLNQWVRTKNKSRQYQTETFFATEYQKNLFQLNTYPSTLNADEIIVFVNNYPLVNNSYDIEIIQNVGFLNLDTPAQVGDKIDVKIFSKQYNQRSVWDIPANLENNAKNVDIKELTLGQLRSHIVDTFTKTIGFEGSFQGINNVKDLGPIKQFGGKILQHGGAPHLANLFLNDVKANFVESILYNQREYARYKNKFLQAVENYSESIETKSADVVLDSILTELSRDKNIMFPFYYSDMIPYGESYNKITYTINDINIDSYYLTDVFDINQVSNKAVLVYLNNQQLTYGQDYTFVENEPLVRLNITPERPDKYTQYVSIQEGDVIEIREYTNTDGSHIPATPSKLGLYPAYRPKIIKDGYGENTVDVIRGHDGSYIKAFGDSRDNVILQFELRIFNNINTRYNDQLFDIASYLPGAFRTTEFSKEEFDQILSNNFNGWLGSNGLKLTDYNNFDSNNQFSYNYSKSNNRIDNTPLKAASWRGIYKYYYDTDQPNLRPWEMLGFSEEPSWWRKEYGPAPYTSGNQVLWSDLEEGRIKDPTNDRIDARFVRPGLSNIIPVDPSGNLLSPFESISANNSIDFEGTFKFGDQGPVESAWRQSSDYPFALQLALALTKPAEYFALLRDTNDVEVKTYSSGNRQWEFKSTLTRNKVEYANGENINGTIKRTTGYTVWISDYIVGIGGDVTEALGYKLRNVDVRLAYKLGGFSDKKYLKIFADQASPNSDNNSIIIPDEDYQLKLSKSSPRLSVTYSGVIIQKTGFGWSVRGYDRKNPYFTVESARPGGRTSRVKVGNETFDIINQGSGSVYTVPYGTELASKFEVMDFLIGLGRYYQRVGFLFEDKLDPDSRYINNWFMSCHEFLLWTQQGWDSSISITVSPIGNKLTFKSSRGAVDAIKNKPFGSRVLDKNFNILKNTDYTVSRDGRQFILTTTNNEGIYLADIDVVDYEHIVVFRNSTRFNDVIYQPESGNRQYRLKLTGFKSSAWDGTFSAPGFILNDNTVVVWQEGRNYYKGEIVKFKDKYYTALENIAGSREFDYNQWSITEYAKISSTMLPNLANKSGASKKFYDFNDVNLELDADKLAKGLIGFTPKDYFDSLQISDISQVKFYQGLLSQKGSNNSIDKLIRAKLDSFDGSIDFFEQWAVRDGSYGTTDNTRQLRIPLTDFESRKDPIVIELLNDNDNKRSGVYNLKKKDLVSYPVPYDKNFLNYRDEKKKIKDLPSAGFVQDDEVLIKASTLADVVNQVEGFGIEEGSRIWIAQNEKNDWSVFRISETDDKVDTIQVRADGQAVITTFAANNYKVNDYVYIRANESTGFTGVYVINAVIDANSFIVQTRFNQTNTAGVDARIFNLIDMRIEYANELNEKIPLRSWKPGDQFYLENASENGWAVYELQNVYDTLIKYTDTNAQVDDQLGVAIGVDNLNDNLFVGSSSANKVILYKKQSSGRLIEDSFFANPSPDVTDFGSVISSSDSGIVAIGSPQSDNGIGFVHILQQKSDESYEITQAIAPLTLNAGGEFGYSIALSKDAKWLYIGQPGLVEGYIWAYQLIPYFNTATQTFTGNNVDDTFTLTGDAANPPSISALKIIYDSQVLIPYRDYDLSGDDIIFTFVPEAKSIEVSYVSYYEFVTAATLSEASGDRFGHSLATTDNGSQLIIGAPLVDDNSSILSDSGKVYIVERTIENQFADGFSTDYSSNLTVFGEPLVKIDDVIVSSSEYTFDYDKTVSFDFVPEAGSIITIESNNPILAEVIDLQEIDNVEAGSQFGYSVDLCPNNCSLYVGAPYEDSKNNIDSGKVYRFINQGRFYGSATGKIINPVLTEDTVISINNFPVFLSNGDTLTDIIIAINDENIPGVTALSVGNVLTIETNSNIFSNKLNLALFSGNFYEDVGIDIYYYQQTIDSPQSEDFSNFGKVVKISPDALTLAVGSDRMSTILSCTFDNNETTFDTNNTQYIDRKKQSGAVFLYDFISDISSSVENTNYFVFAEQLKSSDIKEDDQFGYSIAMSGDTIYIGAPGNDSETVGNRGIVYGFTNSTGNKSWNQIRQQSPKVDIDLINAVYLYNQRTHQKITDLDFIDPAKGKVSGIADQDISYKSTVDPATYGTFENNVNLRSFIWGKEHVGEIWWDTNQTRWCEYEQDSIEYRAANWGFAFPGSLILCYEWTESDVLPSRYNDPDNPDARPLNFTDYNEFVSFNEKTKVFTTKYYFWVLSKSRRPKNNPNRRISARQIETLIANPRIAGQPFAAFIDSNAIALYNVDDYVKNDDVVLVVDYDLNLNNNIIHSEFQLIASGDKDSLPSESFVKKLIDSLAGEDSNGNLVPDKELSEFEKYGISFRPRQTLFKDRRSAVREAVAYLNNFLVTRPIVFEKNLSKVLEKQPFPSSATYNDTVETYVELSYLNPKILPIGYKLLVKADETVRNRWVMYEVDSTNNWKRILIQSYNNSRYINIVDWTDPTVDVPDSISKSVEFEYNLQQYRNDPDTVVGDFVYVRDNGLGNFKVVQKQDSGWRTVREQNATIQIDESIYKQELNRQGWDLDGFGLQLFDDWPSIEIRNILNAIYNDVLTEDSSNEKNAWIVHMMRYVLNEQDYVDWLFKTSLIKVKQRQNALKRIPVYQFDNQNFIKNYIEEVKPYHTKINEFVIDYDGLDLSEVDVTDFDLPAYYSFSSQQYRSPTGENLEDDFILTEYPYTNWVNNHTLELEDILVYDKTTTLPVEFSEFGSPYFKQIPAGGENFFITPEIIIEGGGGSGAKARAIVGNGKILKVEVLDSGSGYITTPFVYTDTSAGGEGAILVPVMRNSKVRSFDTTIKFDRISTGGGFLITLKNSFDLPYDIRNQRISRLNSEAGIVDWILNLFSLGEWIVETEAESIVFPVQNVPNYRFFNDTSGRIQILDRRDNRGWTAQLLQDYIRGILSPALGIDLTGTTVIEDGSMTSYVPNLLSWQANFVYYQNEIIVHQNKLYRVVQQFTSVSNQFDSTYLESYSGSDLESHLDRTWAFYQPKDGMLGKDLEQLFTGVAFPGVNVIGANFNLNPGFDVGGFDTKSFDSTIIGPEGVPVLDPGVLDQNLYSEFLDTALGTRPEDIITRGAGFVDQYSSHAPEEMVPGRVYDSLAIKVQTNTVDEGTTPGYSPRIIETNYRTDGITKRFAFDRELIGDYFHIFLEKAGPRYRHPTDAGQTIATGYASGSSYDLAIRNSYTIDWATDEIVFNIAPSANDILHIVNIGQIGENIVADQTFTGDGSSIRFAVDVNDSLIGNSLVLVNGIETPTDEYFFKARNTWETDLVFDSPPPDNAHIHVTISSDNVQNRISKVYTQVELINDSNRIVELDEFIRYDRSKDTTLIVELNGNRLTPGNTNYYIGDGSTTVYELPISAGETYPTVSFADVQVWKDGIRQDLTNYVLSSADGSTIPTVTFYEVPEVGSDISITYVGQAEYFYNSDNSIRIRESVIVPNDSIIAIKSFSSHDTYKLKTKVFVGNQDNIVTSTIEIGFDEGGFDTFEFDTTNSIDIITLDYLIDSDQNDANRIFVSINGNRLFGNSQYSLISGVLSFANNITVTEEDVIVVTWMSSNIYVQPTTFQIFQDMNGNVKYNRLTVEESTVLTQNLKINDNEIYVLDGSRLDEPSIDSNTPGVIFINGERITYYAKNGNVLSQLRRSTGGTGAVAEHLVGSQVLNGGNSTSIENASNRTWYDVGVGTASNGRSIQNANTTQARFLKEKAGIILTGAPGGILEFGADYIEAGYVEDGYVTFE